MAITTSLKRSYVLQRVVLAVLCVGLGAWGVMDYFVWLPAKQKAFVRAEVYRAVNDAITAHGTGAENATSSMELADARLQTAAAEVSEVARDAMTTEESDSLSVEQKADRMREALEGANLQQWLFELTMLKTALDEVKQTPPGRVPERSEQFLQIADMLKLRLSETDDISEVSTVDRVTRGVLFMPCLPYGLWLFYALARMRRIRYVLDDDGTLKTPGGDIAPDQIADVDMSRWMAKSFATIKLTDGREVKIDDFYHQDAHLIIGQLAHERDPEAWNDDATPVKPEESVDPAEPEEAPGDAETGDRDAS